MGVDAERMNRLNLDGYRALQFTYLHVMQQPAWTVSQVTAALARLSRGGLRCAAQSSS